MKPSSRICRPCACTRVATTTSNPASRAARATGSRCEQKYQSSVTRKRSFGRRPASGEVAGRIELQATIRRQPDRGRKAGPLVLSRDHSLSNAFVPRIACTIGTRAWQRRPTLARILVTGAAGFIGRGLCQELAGRGHAVLGATRGPAPPVARRRVSARSGISDRVPPGRIISPASTSSSISPLVRTGRPTSQPARSRSKPQRRWRGPPRRLEFGRFVLMSSIRAMGATTRPGAPFRAGDPPCPHDLYGRTKLAIEGALVAEAQQSGLDLAILRPPLVYGPGAKGNLRALIRLVASGLPLPFAGIDNRRSLIFLGNLVELVAIACFHPAAGGQVLLAHDGADLSTPELIRALAARVPAPCAPLHRPRSGLRHTFRPPDGWSGSLDPHIVVTGRGWRNPPDAWLVADGRHRSRARRDGARI